MDKIPFGPTYSEMLFPDTIPADVRAKALEVKDTDELNPLNPFNITWKDER